LLKPFKLPGELQVANWAVSLYGGEPFNFAAGLDARGRFVLNNRKGEVPVRVRINGQEREVPATGRVAFDARDGRIEIGFSGQTLVLERKANDLFLAGPYALEVRDQLAFLAPGGEGFQITGRGLMTDAVGVMDLGGNGRTRLFYEPQGSVASQEPDEDFDRAMGDVARPNVLNVNGGIDLDAKKLDLDVARSGGKGVEMRFDPAMLEDFRRGDFTGLTPVILNITPIVHPAAWLGLEAGAEAPVHV
jgi:hypothetical protein